MIYQAEHIYIYQKHRHTLSLGLMFLESQTRVSCDTD